MIWELTFLQKTKKHAKRSTSYTTFTIVKTQQFTGSELDLQPRSTMITNVDKCEIYMYASRYDEIPVEIKGK